MTRTGLEEIVVCRLGRVDYEHAWSLQRQVQQRLILAKRSDPPVHLPHVTLVVEHPPVFTLGKSGDADHLLLDEDALASRGIAFHRIDRGGDITYHGPGQLVVYPILDLDRFFTDIHRYLRELEQAVILTCADFGITAGRVQGRTGVWVGPDDRGPERKICAMGIRCSRWVTMHGLALNVSNALDPFELIIPCGIRDRGVTSMDAEANDELDPDKVTEVLTQHLGSRFEAAISMHAGDNANDFLASFLAEIDGSSIG